MNGHPFADYQILLDSPAANPALGYGDLAAAFANIITTSEPRFAVGIFGGWGSGKTTLMQAIEAGLDRERAIPVRFNAWRYEREEHLIVPLIDTIREGLTQWAAAANRAPEDSNRARNAAVALGRVAKAFMKGLSFKVGLPGALDASIDVAKAVEAFDPQPPSEDELPQSLYHAGFGVLRRVIEDFTAEGRASAEGRAGEQPPASPASPSRIVVFVDDLDRCLPARALEVLESIKLFFDLDGMVFVVGVDPDAIERAIEAKFSPPSTSSATTTSGPQGTRAAWPHGDDHRAALLARPSTDGAAVAAGETSAIDGAEYVKKIFQVPFALPQVELSDLPALVDAIVGALPQRQQTDVRSQVLPHLRYLAQGFRVNPREVKRFINAYTLQLKFHRMLPEIALSLLMLEFRTDWEAVYECLLTEREYFLDALAEQLKTRSGDRLTAQFPWVSVPGTFIEYVSGAGRALVEDRQQVVTALSRVRAVTGTASGVEDLFPAVAELRKILADAHGPAGLRVSEVGPEPTLPQRHLAERLREHFGILQGMLLSHMRPLPNAAVLAMDLARFEDSISALARGLPDPESEQAWLNQALSHLDALQANLRQGLRATSLVGTVSSPKPS